MLNALKDLLPVEASGILADIATRLMYTPLHDTLATINGLSDLEKNVVNEVIFSNNIDPTFNTLISHEKLIAELDKASDEIYVIDSSKEYLKGLEDSSLISNDSLNPLFKGILFQLFPRLMKQDKKSAIMAIKNPDRKELNRDVTDGVGSVSLFAKVFEQRVASKAYILLVVSRQSGVELVVPQFWRIYLQELDMNHLDSLYDLYIKFISRYGMMLNDKERSSLSSFVDYRKYMIETYDKRNNRQAKGVFNFEFFQNKFTLEGRLIESKRVMFIVDMALYIDSLVRKGALPSHVKRDLEGKL